MDWNLFIGLALALFFIRWDQNNINLLHLIKELTILGLLVLLFSLISKEDNLPLIIVNQLPEKYEIWIAALLFISFLCALTHKGWRSFQAQHINRNP